MLNYTLGTIEASEALIKDLYIDLRAKVNACLYPFFYLLCIYRT